MTTPWIGSVGCGVDTNQNWIDFLKVGLTTLWIGSIGRGVDQIKLNLEPWIGFTGCGVGKFLWIGRQPIYTYISPNVVCMYFIFRNMVVTWNIKDD